VILKPRERGGHSPRWAAQPEKIKEILGIWHLIIRKSVNCTDVILYVGGLRYCDLLSFSEASGIIRSHAEYQNCCLGGKKEKILMDWSHTKKR
jgi:hypothetical protein